MCLCMLNVQYYIFTLFRFGYAANIEGKVKCYMKCFFTIKLKLGSHVIKNRYEPSLPYLLYCEKYNKCVHNTIKDFNRYI